ncbi:MAG: hypothetical protein PUE18_03380, partial [Firmicutes bacterium]|nr:hypothetical protein [Bacillota bacterium]
MNFEDTNKEKKVDINNFLKNKKVIIGVVAAVILLLIIALSTSATKIDLGKYFSSNIEVSGVDGHAKIEEGDFYDYDALFDELTTLASGKSIGEVLNAQDEVERSISFSYSVNGKKVEVLEKLSNGDEITIEVMSSLKKSEFFKAKFNNGQTKFKVEGLEKGIEVDAFDLSKIEIRCLGANGYGRVVVNKMNEDDFPIDITYVIEDNEGLKNGDKVTIEAQIGDYSSSFEQYYLKKEKIEYEVKDLLEVAKSAKDFTTSDLEKLKSAAMPKMNGKFFLIAHNTDQVVFDSMILSV